MDAKLGNKLKEYVHQTLMEKELAMMKEAERVRFSVTLDHHDNLRLEYVAKRIGVKKTELVRDAINLLISEFEDSLGLNWDDPEYLKIIFPKEKHVTKLKDGTVVTVTNKQFLEEE